MTLYPDLMLTMRNTADVAEQRRRALAQQQRAQSWGEEDLWAGATLATLDWWEGRGPGPVTGQSSAVGAAIMDEQRAAGDAEQADIRAWRSNTWNGMVNLTVEWLRGASDDRPI